MSFVCKTIDPGTGQCSEWTEAFVLPPLTAEEGTEVAGIIIPVLILAFCLRVIRNLLFNNKE